MICNLLWEFTVYYNIIYNGLIRIEMLKVELPLFKNQYQQKSWKNLKLYQAFSLYSDIL